MKSTLAHILTISVIFALVGHAVCRHAMGDDAVPAKLLTPKPLTEGHQVIALFPPGHPALKAMPGGDKDEDFKTSGDGRVQAVTNIHNPSLELYLAPPEKANGTSVILAAGGGNNTCNVGPEGVEVAKWLNNLGVSCFVHRYRLKPYVSAVDALADTQRAMRTVRANAKEWNIDPNKIGHMGFSAGGEQTARLALTYDAGKPDAADPIERVSSRPDWTVLVYPGWQPGTVDMTYVPKDVPPSFIVCASTGDVFHAKQSVDFYNACFEVGKDQKPNLNLELHLYGHGGHGGSIFSQNGIPFGKWPERFVEWATDLGMIPVVKK